RNRILKLDGEPLYIKVPLKKHSRETIIKDVIINNDIDWKNKIKAQLASYKKKAPYFQSVMEIMEQIFDKEYTSIVDLNFKALKVICDYLEINTPIKIWSEMDVSIEQVNAPDEWALNICKSLKAETYFNPTGGMDFFDRNKYKNAGIDLKFVNLIPLPYNQLGNDFVPFLSIIDILMFNSKE